MKLRTFKVADMSTQHVDQRDVRVLERLVDRNEGRLPAVAKWEEGFLLHVDQDLAPEQFRARLEDRGLGPLLIGILLRAQAQGCEYLILDRDAEGYEDLPDGDWEI